VANRKQRRRREKEKRHEYDIVEIDSEGNETVVAGPELRSEDERNGKGRNAKGKSSGTGSGKRGSKTTAARSGGRGRRGGRTMAQEPSWGRVIRRGGMFAPVFFVIVYLLAGSQVSLAGIVLQTVLLLVVFVPFSYLMDRFVWRTQQRRLAKERGGSA
jgi:hypothetical protein